VTAEDRFERIERDLATLVQVQTLHQETVGQLMRSVGAYIDSSSARMTRTEDSLARTRELLEHFVESSDIRMRRIEENLDALIRAITAEHSNGKATR